MISIQQMHYLVVLSEEKQFQKASERCFVTQPTLSMQVKKAEEILGYPIFDRSANPLELTSFGEELIEICREVLYQMDKMDVLRKQMQGEYVERIRIGIIPTISAYLIPKMFPIWQAKFTNIQLQIVELKSYELLEALESKMIDLAILAGPHNDQKTRTVPLYIEEIKAYVPSYLGDRLTTEQLDNLHPWLLNKGNCLRTQMMQFCQIDENKNSEKWNYEGGSIEILVKMVNQNGGYTLVPSNYLLEMDNQEKLFSIYSSRNGQSPAREVVALFSNRTYKKSLLEALIREVQHAYYSNNNSTNFDLIKWNELS
jgi:LysR family hydrogen peroxide-inducible transcriptional activator